MTTVEPIHPGEHLAEIMAELGITQYRLAKTIGVPPSTISSTEGGPSPRTRRCESGRLWE